MTFNALSALVDSEKYGAEEVFLPSALEDSSPIDLAEARSRLLRYAQVARSLVKVIEAELAEKLEGQALRYGNDILRPAGGKGTANLQDPERWWQMVSQAMGDLDAEDRAALLHALYGASTPRLTALPLLASAYNGASVDAIRGSFIYHSPPTSPLSVMPVDRAPKFLQSLEDGEIR